MTAALPEPLGGAGLVLRDGTTTTDPRLDRLVPSDDRHVTSFPLTADTAPSKPAPCVIGVNWYTNFDSPVQDSDGTWWIGRGDLGRVRGGHCVCVKPATLPDAKRNWLYYDQGAEGACVGFGCSRAMTLLNNHQLYDAFRVYHRAQTIDEWPGEGYAGTSVRAGLEVLRLWGPKPVRLDGRDPGPENARHGIAAYRWATDASQVLDAIQMPRARQLGAVPLLNSWGDLYPRVTWIPLGTLQRLLREDGEIATITDR